MPPTTLCPGRELLEVIRASGQEGRLGVSPCPLSALEREAVSWPVPPVALGRARMKSPEAQTSRGAHRLQDSARCLQPPAPWRCCVVRGWGLWVLQTDV